MDQKLKFFGDFFPKTQWFYKKNSETKNFSVLLWNFINLFFVQTRPISEKLSLP